MKTLLKFLLVACTATAFAENINLPLAKFKTDRMEGGSPIYEFSMKRIMSTLWTRTTPITVPGKICFKVRTKQFSDRSKGSFWGIKLNLGKDRYFNVYSRGRGFEVLLLENSRKIFSGGSRPNTGFQFPNGEANPKWVDVEIRLGKETTEFLINSKTECKVKFGSLPLQSIDMFTYFVDYEVSEPYFIPGMPEKK